MKPAGSTAVRIRAERHKAFRSWGFLLFVLGIWFLPAEGYSAQKGSVQYYFQQGNQAFRESKYEEALSWYQKISEAGFQSGAVFYNMGNCYYKLNKIGKAILFYEKARKLMPDDPEIKMNLELANLKTIDRIELPPQFFLFKWWHDVTHGFTLRQLSRLLIGFYVLSIAIIILWLFVKTDFIRRWLGRTGVVALAITLFWAYLLVLNAREARVKHEAIVLSPTVTVLSAPEENSTSLFVIHEGLKVEVQEQRGEWVHAMLPDGKNGWMKISDVGII